MQAKITSSVSASRHLVWGGNGREAMRRRGAVAGGSRSTHCVAVRSKPPVGLLLFSVYASRPAEKQKGKSMITSVAMALCKRGDHVG
jgi:hypothetical protein